MPPWQILICAVYLCCAAIFIVLGVLSAANPTMISSDLMVPLGLVAGLGYWVFVFFLSRDLRERDMPASEPKDVWRKHLVWNPLYALQYFWNYARFPRDGRG